MSGHPVEPAAAESKESFLEILGQKESELEQILVEAKAEAKEIVNEAKSKADAMILKARADREAAEKARFEEAKQELEKGRVKVSSSQQTAEDIEKEKRSAEELWKKYSVNIDKAVDRLVEAVISGN
jgi:vacuolar-type H+-ATPase subunit H